MAGALALSGCSSSSPQTPEERVEELAARGEYGVGFRKYEARYDAPVVGERTIELSVWYPTRDTEGPPARYYLFRDDDAILDATPERLGPRPVLFFSHGHQAYAESSSFLMEHFARHGYLVVAPTHTGNTTPDGDNRETDIYFLRGHDVSAALDFVLALPEDDPLAGMFSDDIVLAGHSFGGYTAYTVGGAEYAVEALRAECDAGEGPRGYCSTLTPELEEQFRAGVEDDRFLAVLSMAAGDFNLLRESGVAAVDVPVFQMSDEGDGFPPMDPAADAYWSALDGPMDLRLNIVGGAHGSFSDACAMGLGGFVPCSETLTPEEEHRMLRVYAMAFVRRVLFADESVDPILEGEVEVHPAAELFVR